MSSTCCYRSIVCCCQAGCYCSMVCVCCSFVYYPCRTPAGTAALSAAPALLLAAAAGVAVVETALPVAFTGSVHKVEHLAENLQLVACAIRFMEFGATSNPTTGHFHASLPQDKTRAQWGEGWGTGGLALGGGSRAVQ